MSTASNLSKSVASASPTLVHFNQDLVQHLQNARNFVGLQPQDAENNMQDVNRDGKVGWSAPMQEKRSHQQPGQQPWLHYGPPTLSPIQATPIRCFPENEDSDSKGQKRTWQADAGHAKADDNDRKRLKANYPTTMDSKDAAESEYRKILTGTYPPQMGGEMLGYFLAPPDPSKHLSMSKDLQQKMNKIDGEIAMVEHTISNLKAKCNELSKVKMLSENDDVQEAVLEVSESRPQTIARLIYNQNKLKAQQSHNSLASLGAITSLPLYNQPSDTLVYRENKKKFQSFKKLLVAHLAKKQQAEKIRIRYLSERYTQLYNQWVKKLNKRENSSVRKDKDAKYREFFEKVFPDLKKQKDDKEKLQSRFSVPGNRPAGYARSDAGIEEIVNELHEQEVKEKRMLSLSVTPPMMMDSRQRSLRIIDETRLIRSFDFRQKIWTTAETEIFAEKYQQYPKKFNIIATYLENKTVQDCVLFYYLTKKEANYKQMARRYQAMKKRKFRSNPQNQENKMGDSSTTLGPSIGSGFSLPSTILLSSSATANISTPSNHISYLPSSSSASVTDQSKSVDSKKERESPTKIVKTSDDALEKEVDVKKSPGAEASKDSSPACGSSADVADAPEVKLEPKVEVQEDDHDGDSKCTKDDNITESKISANEDKTSSNDSPHLPSLETSSSSTLPTSPTTTMTTSAPIPSPTSSAMTSARVTPTSSTMPSLTPPTAAMTVDLESAPSLEKRDHMTGYTFPSMRVEDVSDKEDSDSVATLSADEGPSMPPDENKELSQIKRPRLLDDGYKDGIDKKRHTEDLVLNWEAKNKHSVAKRLSVDENHQFFMVPNSDRERRSLPPSEDRQMDGKYHEVTDSDLVYSLVTKNRSPARIKDLIHAAIEKNLQNNVLRMEGDLNGCTSPIGSWSSRGETPNNRMPSPHSAAISHHQFQQHFQQQYQKQHPMEPPTSSRHPALRSPAASDLAQQQHLAMKMMSHDRPSSYSPSCFPILTPHDVVAPPPAHSHHHHHQMKNTSYEKPSSRGPPAQYLENNRLYELAAVAAERGRLDEKEKRQHKENVGREMPYPGNIPLSLLRLPCDPTMLHKGLRGNSGGQHPAGPAAVPPLAGIHMAGGRGSITKGTSGRLEAMQQQGSMERHAPAHDWPVPPKTTSAFSLGGLPTHPSAVDYLSSAQVLRGDFLTAHQMGQSHFTQPSHLYNFQQQYQQHYQGLTRQGEKKHVQSPASSDHHLHNKNPNQEPLKKKFRQENAGKSVYHDPTEYPSTQHKKVPDEAHRLDSRSHSRNQPLANYYHNQPESHHYMNDNQRPKSSHQQNNSSADKSMELLKTNKTKEFQTNQMTAANLIEAIIYLQINRSESDENSLKMSGPSSLSNSNLLSHLPTREENLHFERNQTRIHAQQATPISSKSYERTQKYGQIQSGDHSTRVTSEIRSMPDRMGFPVKDDESPHLTASKHVKDNNHHVKKFNPYDHLNQSQHMRHELQNPQSSTGGKKLKTANVEANASQDITGNHDDLSTHSSQKFKTSGDVGQVSRDEPPPPQKFITASDRIEAIIAQDIGNQDDMPAHNEDFQLAIKEYMKNTNPFDTNASLLSRFSYAPIRPYDADKHYDKSFMSFYSPGMIGGFAPLRMSMGQLPSDDKPPLQNMLSTKAWPHGLQQAVSTRNQITESRAATKQMSTMDPKHGSVQSSSKEQRSEPDNLASLKHSPSHRQFKSPAHRTPDPSSDYMAANFSEKTMIPKDQTSDNISIACLNSPPVLHSPSHMTWKAKMLRQHKEQKIAENSHGQHHPLSESLSLQTGSKNSKEEAKSEECRPSRDENKIETVAECKDILQRSMSSSSSSTPPGSGRPSPTAKTLNLQENSLDVVNDSTNIPASSNYWSPRSSTGKCSSNSSDGLRIDIPGEDDKFSNNHD